MNTVRITLKSRSPELDADGNVVMDGDHVVMAEPQIEEIDLNRLSPRARALAEAVAATTLKTATDIWVEADKPLRDSLPDWENWYTPEEAARPERRPWRGWARYPATSTLDPHRYLETEAAKIPAGWHVLGARPDEPVATQAYGMTVEQVRAYLGMRGRNVSASTWRSYVTRKQAPQPTTSVGNTPLWDPADIIAWAARSSAGQEGRA